MTVFTISRSLNFLFWGAGMGQWWERSPPTNVARVRSGQVGWVCCWPGIRLAPRFTLWVLRFSSLPKNHSTSPNSNSTGIEDSHQNPTKYCNLFRAAFEPLQVTRTGFGLDQFGERGTNFSNNKNVYTRVCEHLLFIIVHLSFLLFARERVGF